MKSTNTILKAKRKYEDKLLKAANVNSVGVGYVYVKGKRTDDVGIIVNVEKKVTASSLSAKDRLPTKLDGIRVDVIEKGRITKEDVELGSDNYVTPNEEPTYDFTKEVYPFTTGYSQGNRKDVTAGTTGYFARRDGVVVVTSNAHVQVPNPSLDLSETLSQQASLDILQPGAYDGGHNRRAGLITYQKIDPTQTNYIDSAASKLDNPVDYTLQVPHIGTIAGVIKDAPQLGEVIEKVGRTTGYTRGTVEQVDVTVGVDYGDFQATFKECIMTTNMSAGGDSGSIGFVTVNEGKYMKYRLFAGSNVSTIFFHLKREISNLRLTPLVGSDNPNEPNQPTVELDFELQPGGEEEMYTVHGKVKSTAQNPVPAALVEVGDFMALTGPEGRYEIRDVPAGTYEAKASKVGYETSTVTAYVGVNPPISSSGVNWNWRDYLGLG